MKNLKPIEAAIIYELDKNANISLAKLAKKIKKTQQAIKYIRDKLEKEKIIKSYIPIIDYSKLGGYSLYIGALKLQNITYEQEKEILQKIAKKEEICTLLYSCYGSYDVLIGTIAKDVHQAKEHFNHLLSYFKDKFSKFDIFVITKNNRYCRFYLQDLIEKSNKLEFSDNSKTLLACIEKNTPTKIDELDFKILSAISKDSSKKILELAKSLDAKAETIWNRKKNLEKNKIIIGYSLVLDQRFYNHNLQILKLNFEFDQKTKAEIFDFLEKSKEVWKILETINPGEFLIFLVFPSYQRTDFMNSLKNSFGQKIKSVDFIEVNKIYVYSYFIGKPNEF